MPSLNDLGEFKFSFSNIGKEKDDLSSKALPYDDLPLPDKEAPPMDFTRVSSSPSADDGSSEADSDDGFGFDDFLSSIPADMPSHLDEPPSFDDLFQDTNTQSSDLDNLLQDTAPSPLDDTGGDFLPASEEETSADLPADLPVDFPADIPEDAPVDLPESPPMSEDDSSIPDGSLSGLPDETEPALPDFNLEDLGDLGSEDAGAEDLSPESSASDDFGLGDSGLENTNSGNKDATDFGSESPSEDIKSSQDNSELPEDSSGVDDALKDFDIPEDTLSGKDAPSSDSDDSPDLNDSIDLGGEAVESADVSEDTSADIPSLDDAVSNSDFDSPLPDIDFSGVDESTQDGSAIDMGGEAFESGGEDTSDISADTSGGDFSLNDAVPDTDFSGMDESAPADFDGGTESTGDIDFGDLGADFESDSIELGNEVDGSVDTSGDSFSSSSLGGDDFALPGLEELFDKSKKSGTPVPAAPKKGLFPRRRKTTADELPEADTDIEEIRLSQEQLDRLLKTLSSYPINLRIACEEMIAEQVLQPQQLSKLIRLLVTGANVRETAALAEEILGKPIVIPKSFEKMTGAAFEAEQDSFAYVFVHNFLPVLRLFAVIAAFAASVIFLAYNFIYIPIKAESIYKRGYERIPVGEYQRANQLFDEAFATHQKKKWFYLYAEAFRDQRRYLLAEEKYDELLRYYPRDKKGVLDYAHLQTYYMLNYDKANRLLQQQLLDYAPDDYDGLLAAGDNFLLWADSDPDRFYDKYEDARFSYARLLESYGWQVPVVERMLRYFIHTDNLKEVLYLRIWFENDSKRRRLSPTSLSELGGYLLDKQLEKPSGVPDPYIESIESVRDMLLRAVREEPTLPEPHYHLARYHNSLGNTYEERLTLENAIRAFDLAQTETVRRRLYRVDTHYRYANLLINNREFFPAEEQIVKGIQLYEDFVSRNLISITPQLGQLYAVKGDLEYFVKSGNMRAALNEYQRAERYGWAPPEMKYRMGAAYYQLEDWADSLHYLFNASTELPLNRRLLYALGNVAYQRGDYFAAQGYYSRLIDILDNQRVRLPVLLPNDNPQFLELGERMMMTWNNAGVVYEALAEQTGNREYRSRALAYYAESARAWDSITRNPQTMIRMRLTDSPGAPGINLGYLNANNALRPNSNYSPEIFIRIDKDVAEPSRWEELAQSGGLGN
ncbi:MAG: tetratricopeptide repeat protein [Treponema sp.]|jgi:tetratricopeptide (TPR) repeat protein|nr:tetratricopeptide repeat protein [Treponema sp.]